MEIRGCFSLAVMFGVVQAVAVAGGPYFQTVSPGQSIQAAIDRAPEGGWIFVQPGIYQETTNATNGLNITRGVNLVGLSTPNKKVVLNSSGSQRNGIVAVPAAHTNCMSCHSSLAPPFPLLPGVNRALSDTPVIYGLSISGITIQNFVNNGLFTRNVTGFAFVDIHIVGSKNYGIFPTLSKNGLIANSSASGADDAGIWIETSQYVSATNNLVEGNVLGFEISNSDDVLLYNNEARGNSVGIAVMFLPEIFDARPDIRRVTLRNNSIHDNNKVNTGRPGSPVSFIPSSIGVFHLGADDSQITDNVIENHNLAGIAVVDCCLAQAGGPLDCSSDPRVTPGFVADNAASNNKVARNRLRNNGTHPDPASPFAFAASDIAVLTGAPNGNCFTPNTFTTFFSTLGFLPPCH